MLDVSAIEQSHGDQDKCFHSLQRREVRSSSHFDTLLLPGCIDSIETVVQCRNPLRRRLAYMALTDSHAFTSPRYGFSYVFCQNNFRSSSLKGPVNQLWCIERCPLVNLDESHTRLGTICTMKKKPAESLGAKLHDSDMSSWFAWEHCVLIPMSTIYQGVGKSWQNHQGLSRMLNWYVKLMGSIVKNAFEMTWNDPY